MAALFFLVGTFLMFYRAVVLKKDPTYRTIGDHSEKIRTEIVPFSKFYLAEDYHQKYYLRGNTDLMREFKAMYPRDIDFVNSTAAARVNGYIGGHGTLKEVQAVNENLGLSPASQQRLLALAKRWKN